jgi:hypothetical protein
VRRSGKKVEKELFELHKDPELNLRPPHLAGRGATQAGHILSSVPVSPTAVFVPP